MRTILLTTCAIFIAGCAKKEPLHDGKAAAQWRETLQAPDAKARKQAANALAALKSKHAVPDLISALKDKDAAVRASAAEALWSLGPDAHEAVPHLVPLLNDKDAGVRLNAAGALGDIGPQAAASLPALRQTLKDNDPYVRAQAATAIGRFRSDA